MEKRESAYGLSDIRAVDVNNNIRGLSRRAVGRMATAPTAVAPSLRTASSLLCQLITIPKAGAQFMGVHNDKDHLRD
jgi:hypothetical protein